MLGRILRSRCMDFHRQKKKRYCEDLNGETFAAEEYRMQLHQPGLVDVFSGKERCKAILDEVDPYAGKLAESCGVEINRRTANQ